MKKFVLLSYILSIIFLVLNTNLYAQARWSPDQRLVFMQGTSWHPRADCRGDTIHLVWYQFYWDSVSLYDEVFYKRSTDAGFTWGGDVRLSIEDSRSSTSPEIAISGNVVHVVWREYGYGLLYRRSTDGGENWGQFDSIVPGGVYSSIQAIGDTVYIAVTIGSLGVLRFIKSYDGGNSWGPIQEITSVSDSPRLRIIGDTNIVISYARTPEIFIVRSLNGGETWLDSQLVSESNTGGSQWSAMDTDDNAGVHVTWYDYKYSPYPWTGDIFYRVSRDSGNTWYEIDSLTIMHRAAASDILAEHTNLHLVWEDDRHDFTDNFEIYYRMSNDLGLTWGSEIRLTDTLYHSIDPSLTCNGNYLHLFWQDRREYGNDGSGPLYYKRKDLSSYISENRKNISINPGLNIYPNPFNEKIDINWQRSATEYKNKNLATISIFDIEGKEVMFYEMSDKGGGMTINMKDLPSGVYFVQVEANEKCIIKKIIKIK